MVLKRALKTFLALSAVAVAGLCAYHYSVEDETATTAAFRAMEEYNRGMARLASVFTPVLKRLFVSPTESR
ncbi:MAG: hypothetical protein ABEJ76_07220 [Halanaeroarchaeum sp.]